MIDGACQRTICDFEDENICGYTVEGPSYFKWKRNTDKIKPQVTGPYFDFSENTAEGHFMFVE